MAVVKPTLNQEAADIARYMVERRAVLGLEAFNLPGGATVIDAGVQAPGGSEAGRLLTLACLGGRARVEFAPQEMGARLWPGLQVTTEEPVTACLGGQYAGWALDDGAGFQAMGSGPARALAAKEDVIREMGLQEHSSEGVLALEARGIPTEELARQVADACAVDPENLYLLVAPTASLAGSVQVAARVVETGVHKLLSLGYDVSRLRWGYGTCPLPPVARDDLEAIGRTNDAVLFGGRCYFAVDDPGGEILELLPRVPSSASRDYGAPFVEVFRRYGGFYSIDPLLFSPAQVVVNNLSTGEVAAAGYWDEALLRRSFWGEEKD